MKVRYALFPIVALIAVAGAAAQATSEAWVPLIDQGRVEGMRFLETRDDKAKASSRKALKEAEKLVKDALKRDPACERCHEGLVTTAFQQAYFGYSRDYAEFLELAARSQDAFPANGRIALYMGTAQYNSGDPGAALRSFKRYLASSARDRDTDAMVTSMVAASQQTFLTGWNRYANFYELPDSRIVVMNPQTFVNEVVFQTTPDWEVAAANQAVPTLLQQGTPLQDAELQAYLEELVSRLVGRSPGSPFTYRITVLDTPTINAVTVPGQIFVCTGLLSFVETEAQLAGVLAHELAHNYGHHAARSVIKQWHAQNVANLVVGAVGGQDATTQAIASLVTNLGVGLFVNAHSRVEEREADLYGAHILYNAGYNPTAMAEFHLKMYEKSPRQPVKFLSTHPPSPDRATYLTDYLEAFDLQQPLALDSEKFQRMRQRFAGPAPAKPASVNPGP